MVGIQSTKHANPRNPQKASNANEPDRSHVPDGWRSSPAYDSRKGAKSQQGCR